MTGMGFRFILIKRDIKTYQEKPTHYRSVNICKPIGKMKKIYIQKMSPIVDVAFDEVKKKKKD